MYCVLLCCSGVINDDDHDDSDSFSLRHINILLLLLLLLLLLMIMKKTTIKHFERADSGLAKGGHECRPPLFSPLSKFLATLLRADHRKVEHFT